MANRFEDVDNIRSLITQAVGAGSMCWEHIEKAGVFDDQETISIVNDFMERYAELEKDRPYLGFATNEQLVKELAVRYYVGHTAGDYRTVDGE